MEKAQFYCFAIKPIVLFENESGFLFLETKKPQQIYYFTKEDKLFQ